MRNGQREILFRLWQPYAWLHRIVCELKRGRGYPVPDLNLDLMAGPQG